MSDTSTVQTSVAQGQLRSLIERIERLEEEKKALAGDIREVYAEAKANGFDTKIVRKVVTLRKKDRSLKGKRLFLSKGAHLVVPHERMPVKNAVYSDIPDGRMIDQAKDRDDPALSPKSAAQIDHVQPPFKRRPIVGLCSASVRQAS